MPRLWAVVAGLALVGTACSTGGVSDAVRSSSAPSTAAPVTTASVTTSTTTPAFTSTTTTTAPPAPTTTTATTSTSVAPAPDTGGASPPANGRLPDASLTSVTPSCRILNELARRLRALLDAAHADGIALWPETQPYTTGAVPPHLTSCYRELDIQQWWRDYYCGLGSCGMAAVPGTSVHGWGRAVDFEEGGQELAFDMPGYQWLVVHAPAFGFAQPGWAGPSGSSPEPWHWEAA